MTTIQIILAILSGVSIAALWIAYGATLLRFFNRPRIRDQELFGVSILKPLKGVDEGLYENLRAIVTQDHPRFEVIFGAESPVDPALDVARRIAADYPEVRIKLVTGAIPHGLNPKVRLLRRLIEEAEHAWILVSDSNVRPDGDYLRAMQARQVETGAELVHSILTGLEGRSLGGRLEDLQLGGWVAASICLSDRVGHPCVIGKSMLLRRRALDEIGGLDAVQDVLAEDYIIGAKLTQAGKTVALSSHRLPVVTGTAGIAHFFNRHVRWGQMRRRISPAFFCAELSVNPTPFLLALVVVSDGRIRSLALMAQAAKWGLDAIVYLWLSFAPSGRTVVLIPLKDLLVPVMWGISAFKKTVRWRGHEMLVGPGSLLMPLHHISKVRGARKAMPLIERRGEKGSATANLTPCR